MKRLVLIILAFPLLAGFAPVTGPTDRGNEAYGKGDYAEALKHYRYAAEARPDSPEAHYNLGNAYYRLGEYEKALGEYHEAARLDPEMSDAYYNAGDSLFRMKMYPDALKSYGRAKEIYKGSDPDTEHNIEVTKKLIEKEKQEQQKQGGKGKGQDEGQQEKQQQQPGDSGKGGGAGQQNQEGRQPGPPQMSNEELKALLERQASEEKRLRNYFRPGEKKDGRDRENEIEQMLRGMGIGPTERRPKPGQPFVERDW